MRLFLKWTAGEAGGGGANAEVYGCVPRGVWHQEQLPTTLCWGSPWSCQVQETEPSRVLRAPWARLLVRAASCLTPPPQWAVTPFFASAGWVGPGSAPSCPGPMMQVVVPVCVGRGRADSTATAHPSP